MMLIIFSLMTTVSQLQCLLLFITRKQKLQGNTYTKAFTATPQILLPSIYSREYTLITNGNYNYIQCFYSFQPNKPLGLDQLTSKHLLCNLFVGRHCT
ncbi:hypothetical protein ACB094_04G008000 [Castanea mollissima]